MLAFDVKVKFTSAGDPFCDEVASEKVPKLVSAGIPFPKLAAPVMVRLVPNGDRVKDAFEKSTKMELFKPKLMKGFEAKGLAVAPKEISETLAIDPFKPAKSPVPLPTSAVPLTPYPLPEDPKTAPKSSPVAVSAVPPT